MWCGTSPPHPHSGAELVKEPWARPCAVGPRLSSWPKREGAQDPKPRGRTRGRAVRMTPCLCNAGAGAPPQHNAVIRDAVGQATGIRGAPRALADEVVLAGEQPPALCHRQMQLCDVGDGHLHSGPPIGMSGPVPPPQGIRCLVAKPSKPTPKPTSATHSPKAPPNPPAEAPSIPQFFPSSANERASGVASQDSSQQNRFLESRPHRHLNNPHQQAPDPLESHRPPPLRTVPTPRPPTPTRHSPMPPPIKRTPSIKKQTTAPRLVHNLPPLSIPMKHRLQQLIVHHLRRGVIQGVRSIQGMVESERNDWGQREVISEGRGVIGGR